MNSNHDVPEEIGAPDRILPEHRRNPRVVVVDRGAGNLLYWGELECGDFGRVKDTTLSNLVLDLIEERVLSGQNGGVVSVDGVEYVFCAGRAMVG